MFGRLARRLAGQAARQAVSHAKSQHSAAKQPAPDEPDLALLFAMRLEAAPTWDRMDARTGCRAGKLSAEAGRLGKTFCVACVGGVGTRARSAIAQVLQMRPKLVVCAGLGGALDRSLVRGDIVLAPTVCDEKGCHWAGEAVENFRSVLPQAQVGRLLTTEHVVRLPEQRARLADAHDAIVCDMETAYVAEACHEADVPLLAIRCISDEADEELPSDIATLLDQTTTASRLGAAAGAVFRSPSRAVDLWNLRKNAQEAAEKLAEALAQIF